MFSSKKSTVFFLSLIGFFSIAKAQNLSLEIDSANFYFQKKNFALSAEWFEKAKISAKQPQLDTIKYADINRQLAACYYFLKNYEQANIAFKEAISTYEKLPSKRNQLASTLLNYAVFYFNQRKYAEALPIFIRAAELKKGISGESNADYLTILHSLAQCQVNLKQYIEAETNLKKVVALRGQLLGGNHADYLASLTSLAELNKTMLNYEKSLEQFLELAESVKDLKGENSKEYAGVTMKVANLYELLLNYNKALQYYELSSTIFKNTVGEKSTDYATALLKIASCFRHQGKYIQAEPLYLQSESIFKEVSGEISADYATILNNIALYYAEIGKYNVAEDAYKYALEISRQVLGDRHPETSTTYSNLGLLYKNMGRYEQAEPILKKALKNRKDILGEETPEYAASLNNLAGLFESMGRYAEAEPLYNQALTIFKKLFGEKNIEYASTLNNLAGIYEIQKKYDKAEEMYKNSLLLQKELYGESHPDYISTLNNFAILLESLKKYEEAERIYKLNLESLKSSIGTKHPNYATALVNYAKLLSTLSRYVESEKYLIMSKDIRKEILGENHPDYASVLYEIAKIYTVTKQYMLADQHWEMALNLYLNQIDAFFPAMSEKEKAKFYQLIAPKFEQFNSYVLIRYNENPTLLGKMYDYQLATKALLLNSTNKVKERILSSNDFILIEKFKKWNTQKELLAKAANMTNDERKQLNVNLTELAEITNELEKELNASSELFKNANDTRRVRWSDVQKQLKNDEAAIELIRFVKFRFDQGGVYTQDSIFYAGLIVTNTNKNNPDIVILKNGTELEKQYLKYYRNSIKSKSEDEFSYNQYWLRIKKGLNNNIKKIYLSPDGVYNLINLNTLKNIQTKTYLLDELDIRIVTNTKTLLATQTSNKNIENKIVLIGSPDFAFNAKNIASKYKGVSSEQAAFIERAASGMLSPLPGTRIEVEKIAGMLTVNNWQTQIFTEVNASEESIKKVVNPRILHIATHGFFEEDVSRDKNKKKETLSEDENPLLKSGIMLAGASLTLIKRKNESANLDLNVASGTEDGILTAYEAMNLSLDKTDLVVLSACETGLGEVKNGEGVYGLQRAFNVAGAKTLIFSLWTVNDAATQQLMTTFYSEMLKPGNTKRQSFKNAQLELRKTFPEPYYWGAFVMVGD